MTTYSPCSQCGTSNLADYSFCGNCGAPLDSRHFTPPVDPQNRRRIIWVVTSVFLLMIAFFGIRGQRQTPVSERGVGVAGDVQVSARSVPDKVSPQEQTLAQVKSLWEDGAKAKRERRFADAATAWKEALEIKPGHPGIQEALDKLPVEVSYSVESEFNVAGQRCDVTFLNEKQKRVRLKNVILPWRLEFIASKGQPLFLTSKSTSRQSPSSSLISVGDTPLSPASSETSWWLGYSAATSCRAKADYSSPSAYGIVSDPMPGAKDDATLFEEKLREVFGDQSDLLVANAQSINRTDILMVTLRPDWDKVSSDVRIEVAQDFYSAWKKIRTPRHGKQVYLLLVGENARRLGGSKYPDGSQLWVVNQGKQAEIIPVPNGILLDDASTAGSSESE